MYIEAFVGKVDVISYIYVFVSILIFVTFADRLSGNLI